MTWKGERVEGSWMSRLQGRGEHGVEKEEMRNMDDPTLKIKVLS